MSVWPKPPSSITLPQLVGILNEKIPVIEQRGNSLPVPLPGGASGITGWYESLAYLTGDGVADDRAALNTLANTTIPATGGTILFEAGTYRIGSDVTIPAKVTLHFVRGAKLSLDTGVVVTILGEIVAGPWQIFTGATVGVRFATSAEAGNVVRPRVNAANPEWWGAAGDNSTDDWTPCQRMRDAVSGYPFFSQADSDIHTATGGTNTTVTVAGAGWCPNQWQGAGLVISSGTGSGATYFRIASNTATVITIDGHYTGSENGWTYNAGDFTNGAGAPAAGSVIILTLAAASPRWARFPIKYTAKYFLSKPLRCANLIGLHESGLARDSTQIRVGGGESGTATGGSTTTLVKGSATWTVNQWRRFWVVLLTGTDAGGYARIESNTATTLTFAANSSIPTGPDGTTTFAIIPECVMDLNGWFMGTMEELTLTCETTAGMTRGTMFGVYYHRRADETQRGSSNGYFKNVWVGGHWFWSSWQFGGGVAGYYDPWQEDLPQFENIRTDGSWSFSYTGLYYKYSYYFGSGQYGNNLNHLGNGIHASAAETLIGCDRTNLYLNGVTSGPCRYGLYTQGGAAFYVEVGAWRAETISRLLHSPLPSAATPVTLRSVGIPDWHPIYDATLDSTPLVYTVAAGGTKIDGLTLGGSTVYVANEQATSGTTTTCTKSTANWTVDQYKGFYFRVRSGTGKFQPPVRISGNTATTLTFATLSVAPDATTFFDVYAVPEFRQQGPGTMHLERLSVAGLDLAKSFISGVISSQIIYTDIVIQDPLIGGQINRYVGGPVTVLPQSDTASTAWLQTQQSWSKYGSKVDTFIGRLGDGVVGISRLSSPVVTVPAIGTTDSVLTDKQGSHTRSISQITRSGVTATVTIVGAHLLTTGDTVAISGADETEYNTASVSVTVTSSTQFTYTIAGTPGPAIISISSITRAGGTATATSVAHGRTTGDNVTIAGAVQPEYNGTFSITVTGVDTFTYAVAGSPATPATGTITAGGTVIASGITTKNYKLVAKVPGPGGTYRRALASAAISLTNCWPVHNDDHYSRIYPPYTPADPAWVFDVLKDTGGGTYAVFVDGENLTTDELYTFKDLGQATKAYTLPTTDETGRLEVGGALVEGLEALTYGATIATDCNLGTHFTITVTNNTNFTISNPTSGTIGQRLTYSILNSSGGAMGTITWGGEFKMAGAFTNPGNGNRRTITFLRETGSAWVEQGRAMADVA